MHLTPDAFWFSISNRFFFNYNVLLLFLMFWFKQIYIYKKMLINISTWF